MTKEQAMGKRQETKTVTLAVTGASGAACARTMVRMLDADARVRRVHFVVTPSGMRVLTDELGIRAADPRQLPGTLAGTPAGKFEGHLNTDIGAPIASGSYPVDGMAVLPCSVGTLGKIANGLADDLVGRAADVCLKEGRRLVLCVRETPLSRIHLENMLRAQAAGAVIMPVAPAFYAGAETIEELVTQYVCRVLEHLELPQEAQFRWKGQAGSAGARRLEIARRPPRGRK
ncbi:MAG TPA: UbiX family flavin prenyltransferase [Candidatus Acidoferrales bacterium]|nr:UbiX family flavin prenyltransferase [Candidatus Acidoferrales bacterium]